MANNNYKYEIGQRVTNNKRDLTIIDREIRIKEKTFKNRNNKKYTCNEKWYKCYCNICGWDGYWVIETNTESDKTGCTCCGNKIVVEGINDIATTDKWMIPIVGEEFAKTHTHGSNTDKFYPICPDCGRKKSKKTTANKIYQDKGISCPCNDNISVPNKIMFNVLEQLSIDFETEYSPNWIGLRRYDFYIPSMNIIIEMDGGWHKIDNTKSGQTKEESKDLDDYKDEQARLHGIEVIRIDCKKSKLGYIKEKILESNFSKLFDLSTINWIKVEKFTCTNLVKVACQIKKNNLDYTTVQIGEIMKMSSATIISYLKKGSNVGWCDYDAKSEQIRVCTKNGKKNGKLIDIFKNEKYLGRFQSALEIERQSEKLFGIKFVNQGISTACKQNKTYKGYTFKHVEI